MDRFPELAPGLRPLSETERELSEHLIRGALPSTGELIEQLSYAHARGEPPFVEFEVAHPAPRAKAVTRGVVEGRTTDPTTGRGAMSFCGSTTATSARWNWPGSQTDPLSDSLIRIKWR